MHFLVNEYGILAQGIGGRVKNATNTIFFVNKSDIPRDQLKDVTYAKFIYNV